MQLLKAAGNPHNAAALPQIVLKFSTRSKSRLFATFALAGGLLLVGCGKRPPRVSVPPAPPPTGTESVQQESTTARREEPRIPSKEPPVAPDAPPISQKEPAKTAPSKPSYLEVGTASWYGLAFHQRRTANGELYDMNAFTAAHRTLPFNSRVRVTNVGNGRSVEVRITDRGPFVSGRIIDLSYAAAKRLDMWRQGTARVKIEAISLPPEASLAGRWAVLIGAFEDSGSAAKIKEKLQRRYRSANVVQYAGPTRHWWVRVRVLDDDRRRAEELARDNHTPQGELYLVRLD